MEKIMEPIPMPKTLLLFALSSPDRAIFPDDNAEVISPLTRFSFKEMLPLKLKSRAGQFRM
jgi:hypothetical protein